MIKLFRRKKKVVERYVVICDYTVPVNGIKTSVNIFDDLSEARTFKQQLLFDNMPDKDCVVKIILLSDYRKDVSRTVPSSFNLYQE
jgi:hypothetical protein